jgi:hypothetical protein
LHNVRCWSSNEFVVKPREWNSPRQKLTNNHAAGSEKIAEGPVNGGSLWRD